MKVFLLIMLSVLFFYPTKVKAYQSDTSGFIILKNGTREFGSIDDTNLEENGVIIFKNSDGQDQRYSASDIEGFSIEGKDLIRSLEITYSLTNSEDRVQSFFALRVFNGPVHLEEIYAAPFKNAVTKYDITTALQRVRNDNSSSNQFFDEYKGVFYLAFRDCQKTINTDNIQFNEDAFINVLKEYKACIEPSYTYEKEKGDWGALIGFGRNGIQLDIVARHQSRLFEEKFITNYKKSSGLNFYLGLERRLFREIVFITLNGGYQKYSFIHENRENQRLVGSLTYSEIILGLHLDFRFPNKYIVPKIGFGYQYHNIGNGAEGAITGELYTSTIFTSNSFFRNYSLKPLTRENQDYSTPYLLIVLNKDIFNQIGFGINLKSVFRNGEYFTENSDLSEGKLSTENILSMFILYRF